ncbi:MAG TPA: NIPSNAP family protein [Nitrobacter sp.]|nr:NIPSNAP family protein [Nitrobacter sp.]
MIYEIRIYEAHQGKADAMKARFKNEVVKRLPLHGIELLGVFESEAEANHLTYMTRFASEDDRAKSWTSFGTDPDWRAVKAASEIHGPLLKNQSVSVLLPAMAGLLLA